MAVVHPEDLTPTTDLTVHVSTSQRTAVTTPSTTRGNRGDAVIISTPRVTGQFKVSKWDPRSTSQVISGAADVGGHYSSAMTSSKAILATTTNFFGYKAKSTHSNLRFD